MYGTHTAIRLTPESVETIIDNWPSKAKDAAYSMIHKYGYPHEITNHFIVWHHNSPWKRTIVHREGIPHNFPTKHLDLIEQTVDMRVSPEKYSEIVKFNGSVSIDRTKGEVTVHCQSERQNILVLNLAHDIAIGRRSAKEARTLCSENARTLRMQWPEPYTQGLTFTTDIRQSHRQTQTPDPDIQMKSSMFS